MRGLGERREFYRLSLVLSVSAALGVAGCGQSATRIAAGLPPVPQITPGDRAALAYLDTAYARGFSKHRGACLGGVTTFGRSHLQLDHGSPSPALLSSFAVLSAGAKTAIPSNSLPEPRTVFVNYVRVAQRRFGWPFKVLAVKDLFLRSSGCRALATSTMRASVAQAPARLRAEALNLEHELLLDQQYSEHHPDGICVSGYHGGSFCEPFLDAVSRGGLIPIATGYPNPVTSDLVPNGVVRIAAHYSGEPGVRARSVTVPVRNNLAVWKMTGEPGDIIPTIQWLAADGHVIRTVTGPA